MADNVQQIDRVAALRAARRLAEQVAELQKAAPAAQDVRVVELPVVESRPHSYELRITERDRNGLIVAATLRPME
jgi:hypothetical protein